MSANESSYILGNGLEGVIAFEKAASENETGSVKITDIMVSSDAVAVDATGTQVKATITITKISADVEDGYITRANVTGLNTTKSTDVVLNITKQTALTQTADDISPKIVTAPVGYYPDDTSLSVKSGSVNVPNINNLTGNITFPSINEWIVTESQVQVPITYTATSSKINVTLTSGWIITATAGEVGANATATLTMPARHSWTFDTQTNPPTVRISSGYYPESFSSQLTATAMSMSNKTISVAATGSRIATATAGYIHISGSSTATHTASITQAGWASVSNKTATITANVNGDINLQTIDSNLQAGNIVNGITIFGITGTAGTIAPQVTLPETLENTNNATITSITGSTNQVQVQADVTITPSIEGSVQVIGGRATVKLRIPSEDHVQSISTITTTTALNKYVKNLTVNVAAYTGSSTVIPSTTAITIPIANKMATSNITIKAVPTYTESAITLTAIPYTIPIQSKMATSNITINATKYNNNGYNIATTTTQPSTSIDLTSNFNIADDTHGYMTLNLTTQSKWCDDDTSIQAQLLNASLDYQLPTEYPAGNLVEWSLKNLSPSFSNPGVEYAIRMYWPIRGKIGVNNLGFTVPVYTGESGMTPIEGGDG